MLDAANWTTRLGELARQARVPGAVLGISAGGQEILAACGVLNRATRVRVSTDSVFQVGSITKLWTATMIMQLIDAGLLSLDTTVAQALPGLRLGRMIEVLDGRSWDDSLAERLCVPLELAQTVTLPEEAILHRAAVGHRRGGVRVRAWGLPRSIGPAGLITAAPHDLLTFARFHLDGGLAPDGKRLLSEASVAAMQQPRAVIPDFGSPGAAIGLGWRVDRWDGQAIIGHDGDTVGQSAYLRIDPQARVAACLLTNSGQSGSCTARCSPRCSGPWPESACRRVRSRPPKTPKPPTSGGSPAGMSARHGGSTSRSATAGCTSS